MSIENNGKKLPIIKKVRIEWMNSDDVEKISFGEVENSKLLSSRGLKPELGGLFDPRIFGPFMNFQCNCGKYKGKESNKRGKRCERCDVVIGEKYLQRWMSGHINLVSPVVNMLIFKNISPILSKVLDLSTKDLEKIIYFESCIVINEGHSKILKKWQILEKKSKINYDLIRKIFFEIIDEEKNESPSRLISDEYINQAKELSNELEEKKKSPEASLYFDDYLSFFENWGVKISNGAEALECLLSEINIDERIKELLNKKKDKKASELYRFFLDIKKNNIDLKSMIIRKLIVIPCGLRPVTPIINDDLIAASQINVLYRKIASINERLEKYTFGQKIKVFFREILEGEIRSLQKAVDNLIVGSTSFASGFETSTNIKSLSQMLSGKDGVIRRDSLGKRVDFSARSVIVPNPNLKLDQIGIPVKMAIKLFEFVIIGKIIERNIVSTFREAEKLISDNNPVIFSILNEIAKSWNVLINRAPSLHRPSIQGFHISLTTGKSIELHPLETPPFNADHDGDNVNVFAPQTKVECEEIERLVLSIHHTVDPKNGFLINTPNQEIILGIYYLSIEKKNKEFILFDSIADIEKAFHCGRISLNDLIIITANLINRESLIKNIKDDNNLFFVTTYGKIIFNKILPSNFPYYLNNLNDFNIYQNLSSYIEKRIFKIDEIEDSWKNKISIIPSWRKQDIIHFLDNFVKFFEKKDIVEFLDKLKDLGFKYSTYSGISISPFELSNPFPSEDKEEEIKKTRKKVNEVEEYYHQGFFSKIERKQKIVSLWEDCKSNLQSKLINYLEKNDDFSFYHIWKSEARATSENLTQIFAMRGLTTNYLGEVIEFPIISSVWGGLSPFELIISAYGVLKGMVDIALRTAEAGYLTRRLVEANQDVIIREKDCETEENFIVNIDDDFSFENNLLYGCYLSEDVTNNEGKKILKKGTMVLNSEIILIKENKIKYVSIKTPLTCISVNGICQKCYGADLSKPGKEVTIGLPVGIIAAQSLGEPGTQLTMRTFKTGGFKKGPDIVRGIPKIKKIFDNIKPSNDEEALLAKDNGEIIEINENGIKQVSSSGKILFYSLKKRESVILFNVGDKVTKGSVIVDGIINLEKYLSILGKEKCQMFIINEVEKVYLEQGIIINKKHFHIVARQMLSKVTIDNPGDTDYLSGDLLNYYLVLSTNKKIISEKKKPCTYKFIISSLRNLASFSTSFLSDISFQRTIFHLVHDSIKYPVDHLTSLKSNLIIGNILPIDG